MFKNIRQRFEITLTDDEMKTTECSSNNKSRINVI